MATRLPPRSQRDSLKIGELAEEFDTTPRTIRLYEELGLIAPGRTEGGTRLYQPKDAKRLAVALRLARLGLDLERVRQFAQARPQCGSGAEAAARLLPLLAGLRDWAAATVADLNALQRDIDHAEALVRQCTDCPNRPNRHDCPHCPVEAHLDEAAIARLIWDPDSP